MGTNLCNSLNFCSIIFHAFFGSQAIGYEFDYDDYHRFLFLLFFFIVSSKLLKPSYSLFHSFIHGRLPYEKLKSDPVLRSLLLSLPLRKIVSFIEHLTINYILFPCTFFKSSYDIQLFSNLRMTFILSATRYSPMPIRSMLLELLANWGWKIVLKELFALKH